jgi:hypothetical protein
MPSIFTLEGPNLGYAQATPVTRPAGALRGTDTAGGFFKGVIGLFVVGLIGRWAWRRYKHTGHLFGLGGDHLDTIRDESRSRAEYARRAEAWNAGNADKLSDLELARRFGRGHHQATAQLIRQARRDRMKGREKLWNKLAKGLKGLGDAESDFRARYGLPREEARLLAVHPRRSEIVSRAEQYGARNGLPADSPLVRGEIRARLR